MPRFPNVDAAANRPPSLARLYSFHFGKAIYGFPAATPRPGFTYPSYPPPFVAHLSPKRVCHFPPPSIRICRPFMGNRGFPYFNAVLMQSLPFVKSHQTGRSRPPLGRKKIHRLVAPGSQHVFRNQLVHAGDALGPGPTTSGQTPHWRRYCPRPCLAYFGFTQMPGNVHTFQSSWRPRNRWRRHPDPAGILCIGPHWGCSSPNHGPSGAAPYNKQEIAMSS